MAAGLYDMLCEQGATFTRTLTWSGEDGDPVNLTGYTARMQVRKTVADTDTILELTTENGRIAFGSPLSAGKIELTISAADTAALDPIKAVYDLEMVSPTGKVVRLLQGKFTVSAEVTR